MSITILLSILFELLNNRRTTAATLAEKYDLSPRTVYRYIEKLSPFLPLSVRRGRSGGIYLADSYRLPVDFFTEEEYEGTIDALCLAYAASPNERYLSAKRKLAAQLKNRCQSREFAAEVGEVLLFSDRPDEEGKLRALQTALRKKQTVRLLCNNSEYTAEPQTLLFRNGKYYLYGYSLPNREFFLLPLSSIDGVFLTEQTFRPRVYEAPTFPD